MTKMEPYKTVIVVRKDLDLPVGKWIAQAVHATQRAQMNIAIHYKNSNEFLPICIVCYVKNGAQFSKLADKCREELVPFSFQVDAGHNYVEAGMTTCMCIGPAPVSMVDKVTKKLQLLK